MKLPCGLSGRGVARLLARHYVYRTVRTRGSHMTLTLTLGADGLSDTVPRTSTGRACGDP